MDWLITYSNPEEAQEVVTRVRQNRLTWNDQPSELRSEGPTVIVSDSPPEASVGELLHRTGFERIDPILRVPFEAADFTRIYPSGLFSDLILRVQTRDFRVHRAILVSISNYFYSLLTRFREAGAPVITLQEVDPEQFSDLLSLIYGGRFVLRGVRGLRLLALVNFFQIRGISVPRYIRAMYPPSFEEFPEYVSVISMLYPAGLPKEVFYHITDALEGYFADDLDIRSIWDYLPEEVRQHNLYMIEEEIVTSVPNGTS